MDTTTKRRVFLYFTISLYVGISSAIFGPSLLNLVEQTDSSLRDLSYLFSGGAFAYMFGSWVAGRLFDRFPGHRLLFGALPAAGIFLFVVPFVSNPWLLVGIAMLSALATGVIDVGGNTLLIRVPGINLGPAMNGLHFFFGLGSFLAPLLLAGSLQITAGIAWAFWGFGIFAFLLMIQFLGLPEVMAPDASSPDNPSIETKAAADQAVLIVVIALFYLAFVGVEVGYGNWLSSYAFQMGLANAKTSVLLTSVYWGAFTISRLLSIPLAARLKPRRIVTYDLAGSLIGLGMVFLFPGQVGVLWIGTILQGISMASLFPTMLTYAEGLLKMSGKVTSIFFISGSVGSILLPWVIGRTVGSVGEIIIIRILFLTLCGAGVILLVLLGLSKENPAAAAAGD